MKRPVVTAVLLGVCAVSLAGCKGLFGSAHNVRKEAGDLASRDPAAYAAIQLATGRKALDNRQYAEAITAFRMARADPGLAADAYNGLAIAYANLGRQDLAVRYFNEAIALAPSDERFRSNLARLYRTNVVPTDNSVVRTAVAQAERQAASLQAPLVSPAETASSMLNGAVSITRPETGIVRVSAREVRIGTQATDKLHGNGATRSAVKVETTGRIRPGILSGSVAVAPARSAAAWPYPVRIALPQAR